MATTSRITFGALGIWMLSFLAFVSDAAAGSDYVETVTFTTVNDISDGGADGKCRITCDSHDFYGNADVGVVNLRPGQSKTWTTDLVMDGDGPYYVHCDFSWTSKARYLNYQLFSESMDPDWRPMVQWSITEEGLFGKALDTGENVKVVGWSG